MPGMAGTRAAYETCGRCQHARIRHGGKLHRGGCAHAWATPELRPAYPGDLITSRCLCPAFTTKKGGH